MSPAFIANFIKLYSLSKPNNIAMDIGVLCPERGQNLKFKTMEEGLYRFPIERCLGAMDKY
jgi:hypothetical protein